MRFKDNPFGVLNVTPSDSVEIIDEAYEDKSFFDENNIALYEEARSMLTSPSKRVEAELCWFYNSNGTSLQSLLNLYAKESKDKLSNREVFLYLCENLYSAHSVEEYIEIIDEMDQAMYEYLDYESVSDLEKINSSRGEAGISLIVYDSSFENRAREILLNQAEESMRAFFAKIEKSDLVLVANAVARKAIVDNYDYSVVFEKFIDLYSVEIQSELSDYCNIINEAIEDCKKAKNIGDLQDLFAKVEKFDNMAQPIQLYLEDIGSSDKQKESLEIAFGLRDLSIYFHNEKGLTDLSSAIIGLIQRYFGEIPKVRDIAEKDSVILDDMLESQFINSKFEIIAADIEKNINQNPDCFKKNAEYILANKSVWNEKMSEIEEFLSDKKCSEKISGEIASLYGLLSIACFLGKLLSEALEYIQVGKKWALSSGNKELIKRFEDDEQFCRQELSRLAKKQLVSNINHKADTKQEDGKGNERIGCFVAICLMLFVLFAISTSCGRSSNIKKSISNKVSNTATSNVYNGESTGTYNYSDKITPESLILEARSIPKVEANFTVSRRLQGKVLVWDNVNNKNITYRLRDNKIKWVSGDAKHYVVIVDQYKTEKVASYYSVYGSKNDDIPGYRRNAIVYVYDLRKNKCLGKALIRGENPPKNYQSRHIPDAIYGEIDKAVDDWVYYKFDY